MEINLEMNLKKRGWTKWKKIKTRPQKNAYSPQFQLCMETVVMHPSQGSQIITNMTIIEAPA